MALRMECPICGGVARLIGKTRTEHVWECCDDLCRYTWEVPVRGPSPAWYTRFILED